MKAAATIHLLSTRIVDGPDFMDKIRSAMAGADLTLLANRVGLNPATLRNIQSGRTKWPRDTTLFCLLSALGLEIQLVRKR